MSGSEILETELEVVEGMQFDRGYISPYFVTNAEKMRVEMEDPHVPILREKAFRPAGIASTAEPCADLEAAVIIAEDVEGKALATLVVNKLRGGLRSRP